ncbi:DegT/DnrJ/EryC1/StrS family aminotransferase [Sphingopyxis sp.]|jgi:perosamine synthetase|uniref:DegT/DnrJ/EryC1/StrS family aminotransferase n=1 Tax=Sphingopyxis sp. TaxID=1908224 RepID=UPI002DF074A0|nr:DegT/DnrJ/EryC1/StrS family aminotransferase [Sphingopyxis sp.]
MPEKRPVPVSSPSLSGEEERLLKQCLEEGWISSRGPWIERFEAAVAARAGRRFGIAVSNGSAALEVALAALGIGAGDEVVLPAHTIISCALAILRVGATPVLADSEPSSWCIDPADAERRITTRTRAIMMPHLYGLPADMEAFEALAMRHGIVIVEDASQMIGATCRERPCGSFGAVSSFSFFANKNVTTGEGGMVLTDDPAIAARARAYRDLGAQPDRRFVHDDIGWNYRLGSLAAAFGLAQLDGLEARLARKRAIGLAYRDRLQHIDELVLPPMALAQGPNSYWAAGMLLRDANRADVDGVIALLAARGIEARPFFWPMHRQPVFEREGRFAGNAFPVAERISDAGFYLPCGADLPLATVDEVCSALIDILRNRAG